MPRPKPAKVLLIKAQPVALTNETKAALAGLLGVEKQASALREVEKWLGFFISGRKLIDDRAQGTRGARSSAALTELISRLRRVFQRHYRNAKTETARHRSGGVQYLREEEKRELDFVAMALDSINVQYRGRQSLGRRGYLQRLFLDPRCAASMSPGLRTQLVERIASRARARTRPAVVLAEKITQGKLADGFTARDVLRRGWLGLRTKAQVKSALDQLMHKAWLRAVSRSVGIRGRPTIAYKILRAPRAD